MEMDELLFGYTTVCLGESGSAGCEEDVQEYDPSCDHQRCKDEVGKNQSDGCRTQGQQSPLIAPGEGLQDASRCMCIPWGRLPFGLLMEPNVTLYGSEILLYKKWDFYHQKNH